MKTLTRLQIPAAPWFIRRSLSRVMRLAAAISTVPLATALAEEHAMQKPTIVLVHGAFADSSSWDAVITPLLDAGYPVVAAATPLRGLRSDAAHVAGALSTIEGPIVLVGHSYGGAVISNAADGNVNVRALVFVAGFAPDTGETCAGLAGRFAGGTLGPALSPPTILPDGTRDLYIRQGAFAAQFAADIPATQAARMAATQRPVTEAALNEPSGEPAWRALPSWFIFGSADKNIPAAAQKFMAARASAKRAVQVDGASHVVMISHPDAVVHVITEAAVSLTGVNIPAGAAAGAPDFDAAPVVPLLSEPPARITVDAPLTEPLRRGYVVIRYRVSHARIAPVYGPAALDVSPRLGHLHITVDDLPWRWLDAGGEPLSITGLPPGPHKVLIELVDTNHQVMDRAVIRFDVPTPSATSR